MVWSGMEVFGWGVRVCGPNMFVPCLSFVDLDMPDGFVV